MSGPQSRPPPKPFEEMTQEELDDYNYHFPEEDLFDYLEYVEKHGTGDGYVRPPEELDFRLTETPGRACVVNWYCRFQGQAGPGCERNCMFIRDKDQPRPLCFGFNSGTGVLSPGDFLFRTLNTACLNCRHFLDCCDETEARFLCGDCKDS